MASCIVTPFSVVGGY